MRVANFMNRFASTGWIWLSELLQICEKVDSKHVLPMSHSLGPVARK